tara:strand:- start:33 stop:734 length:702 start_codon:yes stop_codon:yes gene_type:complete
MSTMSDENRVTPQESDEYDPPKSKDADRITSLESEDYDLINPEPKHSKYYYDWDRNGLTKNPFEDTIETNPYASAFDFQVDQMIGAAEPVNINTSHYDTITFNIPEGEDTITFDTSAFADAHDPKPKPDLENGSSHKYQEDKGIEDLKTYVTSTYQGHYTTKRSETQTLDLIHSVGDAEAFCRSNAIKYLSRYDKKGSAKQDILKAMHYCLLLYYFSGNTKEPDYTNTRYETF